MLDKEKQILCFTHLSKHLVATEMRTFGQQSFSHTGQVISGHNNVLLKAFVDHGLGQRVLEDGCGHWNQDVSVRLDQTSS